MEEVCNRNHGKYDRDVAMKSWMASNVEASLKLGRIYYCGP